MATEPRAWIPGESDFENSQYLSRPYTWPTMTPDEARKAELGQRAPIIGPRGPKSDIEDFLFDPPYRIS